MEWPAQSPDLNIIEALLALLDSKLCKMQKNQATIDGIQYRGATVEFFGPSYRFVTVIRH